MRVFLSKLFKLDQKYQKFSCADLRVLQQNTHKYEFLDQLISFSEQKLNLLKKYLRARRYIALLLLYQIRSIEFLRHAPSRSQSLCGCDRQTKSHPLLTAVCGSSGISYGGESKPLTTHCGIASNSKTSIQYQFSYFIFLLYFSLII